MVTYFMAMSYLKRGDILKKVALQLQNQRVGFRSRMKELFRSEMEKILEKIINWAH